jgi:hypothetical protein
MSITIYAGKTSRDLVLKYPLVEGGTEFFRYYPIGSEV